MHDISIIECIVRYVIQYERVIIFLELEIFVTELRNMIMNNNKCCIDMLYKHFHK